MSQDIPTSRYSVPSTRRVYSAQFKAELIATCLQPGASIAATAREHGMNANVLHRWLREHRLGRHQIACAILRSLHKPKRETGFPQFPPRIHAEPA